MQTVERKAETGYQAEVKTIGADGNPEMPELGGS